MRRANAGAQQVHKRTGRDASRAQCQASQKGAMDAERTVRAAINERDRRNVQRAQKQLVRVCRKSSFLSVYA